MLGMWKRKKPEAPQPEAKAMPLQRLIAVKSEGRLITLRFIDKDGETFEVDTLSVWGFDAAELVRRMDLTP